MPNRTPANGGLTDNDARAHTLEHNECPTFGGGAPTAGGADVDADNHWICTCFASASVDVRGVTATGHDHAFCSGNFAAVDVGDYSAARDATAQPHHNR